MNQRESIVIVSKEGNIDKSFERLRVTIGISRQLTCDIIGSLESSDKPSATQEEKCVKEFQPPTVISVMDDLADQLIENNHRLEHLLGRIREVVGEVKILD